MNATKIYRQDIVNDVPKRFETQYKDGRYGDKSEIIKKLNALQEPILSAEIDRIIGNSSWTKFECDVCGIDKEVLYYFKPKYYHSYENSGMNICKDCLKED